MKEKMINNTYNGKSKQADSNFCRDETLYL